MRDKKKRLVEQAKKQSVQDASIEKDQRNKIGILVIGALLLLLICFGIYWQLNQESSTLTAEEKFIQEYESFNGKEKEDGSLYFEVSLSTENMSVKHLSYDQLFSLLEGGTGVIYFGTPENESSRHFVSSFLPAMQESGVDLFYYWDHFSDRDEIELDEDEKEKVTKEASEEYEQLLEKLDDVLGDYTFLNEDGETVSFSRKRLYAPTLLIVKEGEVKASYIADAENESEEEAPSEEEQKELQEELIDMIQEVSGKQ